MALLQGVWHVECAAIYNTIITEIVQVWQLFPPSSAFIQFIRGVEVLVARSRWEKKYVVSGFYNSVDPPPVVANMCLV